MGGTRPDNTVAHDSAHQVTNRLRLRTNCARPIVVLWGPAVDDQFPDVFEHDESVFCPGSRLPGYLMAQPLVMPATEIEAAFGRLDAYVRNRDIGERAKAGLPARTGAGSQRRRRNLCRRHRGHDVDTRRSATDARGSVSVVMGATFGLVALFTRRRWSHLIRVRNVTTAVITTAVGWAALFGVLLAFEALS